MKKGDCIFVYGTLRRGERADLSKQFYSFGVDFLSADKINGKLYHLGSFPGVKAEFDAEAFVPDHPPVIGEVYRIRDASIVAILDAYESYHADNPTIGLYNRGLVPSERGRKVWVYTYNHPVIEDQRIESGDWCKNKELPVDRRRLRT